MAEFDPNVPRGMKTFNAALDPASTAYFMACIEGLGIPTFLVSTDAAKDNRISYATTAELRKFLGNSRSARLICEQYKIWEKHVLIPLKSRIYIYDFGVVVSLLESMLAERIVFNMQPVNIDKIYYLAKNEEETKKWGTIEMSFSQTPTGIWAAKDLVEGGYELYHQALWQVFQQKN